jgi:hypothetical protein
MSTLSDYRKLLLMFKRTGLGCRAARRMVCYRYEVIMRRLAVLDWVLVGIIREANL